MKFTSFALLGMAAFATAQNNNDDDDGFTDKIGDAFGDFGDSIEEAFGDSWDDLKGDVKTKLEAAASDIDGPASSILAEASGSWEDKKSQINEWAATASDSGVAKASDFLGEVDQALASATNALDDASGTNDDTEEDGDDDDDNAGAIPSVAVAMVGLVGGMAVFANL